MLLVELLVMVRLLICENNIVKDCTSGKFNQQRKDEFLGRLQSINNMAVSYTHLTLPTNREV